MIKLVPPVGKAVMIAAPHLTPIQRPYAQAAAPATIATPFAD